MSAAPPFAEAFAIWLGEQLTALPDDNARWRECAKRRNAWLIAFNKFKATARTPLPIQLHFGPMTATRFHEVFAAIDAAQRVLLRQQELA